MMNNKMMNKLKKILLVSIGVSTGIFNILGVGNPAVLVTILILTGFIYIKSDDCAIES